ncbi:MAG: HAD family phosphatase [Bacteroidota bacterium]
MSNTHIDTIVFDLGGVLLDWNPRYVYKEIFESEEKVEWFLEHICTHDWNIQQDAGRTLAEATEFLISKHPEWEKEIRIYYDRWADMLGGAIQETVDLLQDLVKSNTYRILALTNWSGETFPTAKALFPFLHWFEGVVVSGDERLIKPDHRLYHVLFDRYSVDPRKAVFIDDSLPNILAARELGMTAFHFRSTRLLLEEMAEAGIWPRD